LLLGIGLQASQLTRLALSSLQTCWIIALGSILVQLVLMVLLRVAIWTDCHTRIIIGIVLNAGNARAADAKLVGYVVPCGPLGPGPISSIDLSVWLLTVMEAVFLLQIVQTIEWFIGHWGLVMVLLWQAAEVLVAVQINFIVHVALLLMIPVRY
jgi:hypothetical protein